MARNIEIQNRAAAGEKLDELATAFALSTASVRSIASRRGMTFARD